MLHSIYADLEPDVVVTFDVNGRVNGIWGEPDRFSLKLNIGDTAEDDLPVLVGHDYRMSLTLPTVLLGSNVFLALDYRPVAEGGVMILRDQSAQVSELQQKQQMAHDLALLYRAQSKLNEHLSATNEHLAESEAYLAETNRLKSQFLANLAHEIRTPLTSIKGYAQLMRSAASDEERLKSANAIERNTHQLVLLLENMLDQNLLDAGRLGLHPRPCDLAILCEDVIDMFRPIVAMAGLEIDCDVAAAMPTVKVDEIRLRQILVNLLGNAVKFTQSGQVGFRASWDSESVEFQITDTGKGIAEDDLVRIFQPYQRLDGREPGAGLGLAIVKQIIDLMEGVIDVQSDLGRGTCVSIRLPVSVIQAESGASIQRGSVLLVEDDPDIADLLTIVLEDVGYGVVHCTDGLSALNLFEDSPKDMVISDVNLPRLSGIELTSQLRLNGFRGPIVILSASDGANDRRRAQDVGCDLYLKKPIHLVQFIAEIDRLAQELGVSA